MTTTFNPSQFNVTYGGVSYTPTTVQSTSVVEGFVGESVALSALVSTGSFTGSVVSSPAGAAATWSGASLTPDKPGRWRLTAQNGSNPPVAFDLVVFPVEALTNSQIADKNFGKMGLYNTTTSLLPVDPRSNSEKRALLRSVAWGARGPVSDAALAALTPTASILSGLDLRDR